MLQPPCTEAASCNPTRPQAFASHAPEADGRLRGSSLLGLAASLAQGQVGGGLGLVSREELERVLLLPSAGAEPERDRVQREPRRLRPRAAREAAERLARPPEPAWNPASGFRVPRELVESLVPLVESNSWNRGFVGTGRFEGSP